jgi:hypothetical protein
MPSTIARFICAGTGIGIGIICAAKRLGLAMLMPGKPMIVVRVLSLLGSDLKTIVAFHFAIAKQEKVLVTKFSFTAHGQMLRLQTLNLIPVTG